MERNTNTTIYHLKIGNRFYKANDPQRLVWEKVEKEIKGSLLHWAKKDNHLFASTFRSNTEVIFLKSKIETI